MARKSPRFTLAVIATLALTVGLSTTVFSVLDAAFIRPLPYSRVAFMLGIGVAADLFATWTFRTLIRAVVPRKWEYDAAALAGVVALFVAVALLSAFIPARRAASVEPMESLRAE